MKFYLPVILAAAFLTSPLLAQETPPAPTEQVELTEEQKAAVERITKLLAGLEYRTGEIELPGGKATLSLPEGFRYLDPKGAKSVLVDLWGNPPGAGSDTLGLVIPKGSEVDVEDAWAIVLSYEEDGHVSDEDADKIDYADLLKSLKEDSAKESKSREKQGYGKFLLTGWALPPRYDKTSKVLHWAKNYDTGREEQTLNYDMRVLGRVGVLSMNAVAGSSQAKMISDMGPELIGMAKFKAGHTYAEFDASKDKKADYTLAGLVVGGALAAKVLAKGGILVLLAKFGKFLVIPLFALVPWLKRKFSKE
jgi:uncharacterized membrane-anchored protein